MMHRRRTAGVIYAFVVALLSCGSSTEYTVTGTLTENTCGEGPWGGVAPSPWSYTVGITETTGGSFTWDPNDGISTSTNSTVVGNTVTLDEEIPITDEGPDGGAGLCSAEIDENIALTLEDGGVPPPSFTGTIVFTTTPTVGANCAGEVIDGGGLYAALPCTWTYTIVGAKTN